ncbi:MAG: DUF2934 domain-containing protein [Phycisphaerales bacterium]|nr:DUF2934 domain-containing protein [Phycisphaerales bacterium]
MTTKDAQNANRDREKRSSPPVSNEEAVRRRAYEIFLGRVRTGTPGDESSDWLQAEREIDRGGDLIDSMTRPPIVVRKSSAHGKGAPLS